VTVFALRDGGRSAWCTCGDRFESSAAQLTEAWAQAHGSRVAHYPSPDSSPAA
jgi:hypothetical protein